MSKESDVLAALFETQFRLIQRQVALCESLRTQLLSIATLLILPSERSVIKEQKFQIQEIDKELTSVFSEIKKQSESTALTSLEKELLAISDVFEKNFLSISVNEFERGAPDDLQNKIKLAGQYFFEMNEKIHPPSFYEDKTWARLRTAYMEEEVNFLFERLCEQVDSFDVSLSFSPYFFKLSNSVWELGFIESEKSKKNLLKKLLMACVDLLKRESVLGKSCVLENSILFLAYLKKNPVYLSQIGGQVNGNNVMGLLLACFYLSHTMMVDDRINERGWKENFKIEKDGFARMVVRRSLMKVLDGDTATPSFWLDNAIEDQSVAWRVEIFKRFSEKMRVNFEENSFLRMHGPFLNLGMISLDCARRLPAWFQEALEIYDALDRKTWYAESSLRPSSAEKQLVSACDSIFSGLRMINYFSEELSRQTYNKLHRLGTSSDPLNLREVCLAAETLRIIETTVAGAGITMAAYADVVSAHVADHTAGHDLAEVSAATELVSMARLCVIEAMKRVADRATAAAGVVEKVLLATRETFNTDVASLLTARSFVISREEEMAWNIIRILQTISPEAPNFSPYMSRVDQLAVFFRSITTPPVEKESVLSAVASTSREEAEHSPMSAGCEGGSPIFQFFRVRRHVSIRFDPEESLQSSLPPQCPSSLNLEEFVLSSLSPTQSP
ncbi:MAG: hypothetical protein HY939_07575 [Gammaproteobacteria bacterium]|nr:hypothetical protein [Gammaproteobacteria bacterium]